MKDFVLWPENMEVFKVFVQVQTQWQFVYMGGVTGLNYSSVLSVIALYFKKRKRQAIFEDLQLIECGYLSVVNEKKINPKS